MADSPKPDIQFVLGQNKAHMQATSDSLKAFYLQTVRNNHNEDVAQQHKKMPAVDLKRALRNKFEDALKRLPKWEQEASALIHQNIINIQAKKTSKSGKSRKTVQLSTSIVESSKNDHKKRLRRPPKINTDHALNTAPSSSSMSASKSPVKFSKAWHEQIPGRKIKVFWPMDRKFYRGVIKRVDLSSPTPVHVKYKDGDQEMLNLQSEQYEFYETTSTESSEQRETDDDDDHVMQRHVRVKHKAEDSDGDEDADDVIASKKSSLKRKHENVEHDGKTKRRRKKKKSRHKHKTKNKEVTSQSPPPPPPSDDRDQDTKNAKQVAVADSIATVDPPISTVHIRNEQIEFEMEVKPTAAVPSSSAMDVDEADALIDSHVTVIIGNERFDGIVEECKTQHDHDVLYRITFDRNLRENEWVTPQQIETQQKTNESKFTIGENVQVRENGEWMPVTAKVHETYVGATSIIVKCGFPDFEDVYMYFQECDVKKFIAADDKNSEEDDNNDEEEDDEEDDEEDEDVD